MSTPETASPELDEAQLQDQGDDKEDLPVEEGETESTDSATDGEGSDPDGQPEGKVEQGDKKKSGFQRRRERLARQAEEARAEADYWRRVALQQNSERDTGQPKADTKQAEPPKLSDFDSVEDFVAKREEWLMSNVDQLVEKRVQEKLQSSTKQNETNVIISEYQQRAKEQSKSLQDYEEVVAELPTLPVDVQEFLLTSEVGPTLAYNLALYPEHAETLAKLPPVRRIAALGKLEDALAGQVVPKAPAQKVTAVAPRLTKPAADATTKVATSTSEAKSYQEFLAIRNKQLAAQRKR